MKRIIIGLLLIATPSYAADKLIIATSNRGNPDTTLSEFAQKNGYFNKCKMQVEHFWSSSGAESLQVVIAGSADIALSTPLSTAMGAYQKGAPVRLIGSTFTGHQAYWYVKSDSNINSVYDLKGKKVAATTKGSISEINAKTLSKNTNVDFEVVVAGVSMAGVYTGVMSNQFDAGMLSVPTLIDKVLNKEIKIIASAKEHIPERNELTTGTILVNKKSLETKREAIQCWIDGLNKSIDYFFNEDKASEEYAKMIGFSVDSIRYTKERLEKKQFNVYDVKGFDIATNDGIENKALTQPLSEEQLKEFYVKVR